MTTKKKRCKSYLPKPVNVPICSNTRDNLALELRLAVENLILAPSPISYNEVSKMLATIYRTGARGEGLDLASDALTLICNRFERVHKVGVSEAEAEQLRRGAAGLDEMLAHIPLNKFVEAVSVVTYHSKEMGI